MTQVLFDITLQKDENLNDTRVKMRLFKTVIQIKSAVVRSAGCVCSLLVNNTTNKL